MSERDEMVDTLEDAGALPGVRWAYAAATSRLLDDYSEPAGHDMTWIGVTRWILFRDRLDRVFSCGRYAVAENGDRQAGIDMVRAELSEQDIATMPDIAPDSIVRSNLNGSPGWALGDVRWLLASTVFGKLSDHPWPQKSATKQRVAMQPPTDSDFITLFDELTQEEQEGLRAIHAAPVFDFTTLVIGHSIDVDHGGRELLIGRPRMNSDGGPAWHWTHDLLHSPPPRRSRVADPGPIQPSPETVVDAPVKLRPAAAKRDSRNAL
jgi:hypothetical protein